MPRKVRDVKAALQQKGMVVSENRHHVMFHKEIDGVTTLITRISHSATEIGDGLGNLMAKQCALRLREFWNLVDCPLSQEQWDALVRERCANGRNPFMTP